MGRRGGGLDGAYGDVDERDAAPKVRVGLDLVHEGVLAPVAHHEPETHQRERDEQRPHGRAQVDEARGAVQEQVGAGLGSARLERGARLALAHEVRRQVDPDEEKEAGDVVGKVPGVVALVADGGAEVVGAVALDVMVLDVVVVVCVPGVAHERIEDVGEGAVEPGEARRQDAAHVDVLVHHERVGAHVVELHGEVEEGVRVGEAVEEVEGGGNRGAEVEEEVRHEDDVGRMPHEARGVRDVGAQYVCVDGFGELQVSEVLGDEDGGLECWVGRFVQRREMRNCGLVVSSLQRMRFFYCDCTPILCPCSAVSRSDDDLTLRTVKANLVFLLKGRRVA